MQKLSFLANKKFLLFAVLFFVAIGLVLPIISNAQVIRQDQIDAATGGTSDSPGIIGGIVNFFTNAGFLALPWISGPLIVSIFVSDIAKTLFEAFVIKFAIIGTSYTDSPAVQIGWPIVRDLANMLIVLGFVIIGIATALRIKTYQANQLLAKLIVVALLVNFSKVICGVFIDATNILMDFFFKGVNNWSAWAPGVTNTYEMVKSLMINNFAEFWPKVVSMIIFNFMSALSYVLYSLLFILRIVAIWILVILSPLAFVCSVFPVTKGVWQMWLKNFTQWCFIVVPASLFYYIGFSMVNKSWANHTDIGTIITQNWTTYISSSISMVVMPSMMLLVGFFVSLTFSAIGAQAAMNWGKKTAVPAAAGVATKAMGTVGGKLGQWGNTLQTRPGAGGFGKMVGGGMSWVGGRSQQMGNIKSVMQKRRSDFNRNFEQIGARPGGTAGVADIKAVEEEAKKIKFVYDRAKLSNNRPAIDKIRNKAVAAEGVEGAASYKVIHDAKDLNDAFKDPVTGNINHDAIYTRGKFAEVNGAQGVIATNEKLNPAYRRNNEYELVEKAKTMITQGLIPAGTVDAHKNPLYGPQIQDAVEADGYRKASVLEVKNYHKSVLQTPAFINNVRAKILERASNTELTDEQGTAIKNQIPYLQSQILAIRPAGSPPPIAGSPNYEKWKDLNDKLLIAVSM